MVGLGTGGPAGETGESLSMYEGGCDGQCCWGAGGGGAAYEEERMLLTGALLGYDPGVHWVY